MLKFYRTRITLVMFGLAAYGIVTMLYLIIGLLGQTACFISPTHCPQVMETIDNLLQTDS